MLENLYKYSGTFNISLNTNIDLLLKVVNNIFKMHNKFYFENSNDIIDSMKTLLTINKVTYYSELVNNRFDKFMKKNSILLTENNKIATDSKKALLVSALNELFVASSGAQLGGDQAAALTNFLYPAVGLIEAKIKMYNMHNEDLKKKLKSDLNLDDIKKGIRRKF